MIIEEVLKTLIPYELVSIEEFNNNLGYKVTLNYKENIIGCLFRLLEKGYVSRYKGEGEPEIRWIEVKTKDRTFKRLIDAIQYLEDEYVL